uniref:Uncharacterized protein n=1 Tax=Megaselia scalaris TaxID=36166 RepID=T1GZK7_MEGSC
MPVCSTTFKTRKTKGIPYGARYVGTTKSSPNGKLRLLAHSNRKQGFELEELENDRFEIFQNQKNLYNIKIVFR